MLELLFQGLIEWLYGMILEVWEYFFSAFTDVLSVDFDYLKVHIPVIPEIMKVMLAAGWALLLGNLVFQAAKSMMTGLGFEGEDPKTLFTRSFVFSFLLFASPQICRLGLDMTARIVELLDMVDVSDVELVGESTFTGLAASWLLIIIVNLILMFKVFRFLLEIVERYLVLAFLTICAPLAFGVGGSKNTADIFTGWCRMFGSMCFMMVSNMICFKILLSLLGSPPTGADIFLWIALVFGVVKLARKVDAIITRIGLNPAITGDGLGGRSLPGILAYTVMRTMVSQAVRTAGIATGKTGVAGGKGEGANTNGSKPHLGKSAAGASQRGAGGKSAKTAQQKSAPQSGTAKTGQAWQPAGRPITIIPDDREDAAMNGTAPMSGASAVQGQSTGGEKSAERKTSVPPGTTRSPSVVKSSGSVVKHTAAASSTRSTAAQESRKSHTESAKASGGAAASHPGTAGKGASVPKGGTGMRTGVRPGTAGTAHGAAERSTQSKAAGAQPGTAGNAASTRITNVSRTTQVQSTRASAESSQQLQAGAEKAPCAAGSGVVKPVASRQGKSAANVPRFTQRPASVSGGASSTAPAKAGGSEQAKGSAVPSGAATKAGTARQEARAPRTSAAGGGFAAKASMSATAAQEGRTGRTPRQASEQTRRPATTTPARQEARAAHPAGAKAERPHKQPISATARQESRLRTQNGHTEKSAKPVLRHGAAGSAPVSARTPPKDKPERAPRQGQKTDAAEIKSVEAKENTDARKEGAANERTGE